MVNRVAVVSVHRGILETDVVHCDMLMEKMQSDERSEIEVKLQREFEIACTRTAIGTPHPRLLRNPSTKS